VNEKILVKKVRTNLNYLNIKVPANTKIAVVGDIHEHFEQFSQILDKINPSERIWFFSVGDIYEKGFGVDKAENVIDTFKSLAEKGQGGIVKGNHELKVIREARKANAMTPQLTWCDQQPLALSFKFTNDTRLTILHGGITLAHTWDTIAEDPEVCYIRAVASTNPSIQENWHELYDGRFGYIASGHNAQKDGVPKFYNFSCNLDSACYATGVMTAQIFSEMGREELISVSGRARKP
jgi:UDP-2,3-diacylglucosamine pyrophosphatase LpxH